MRLVIFLDQLAFLLVDVLIDSNEVLRIVAVLFVLIDGVLALPS